MQALRLLCPTGHVLQMRIDVIRLDLRSFLSALSYATWANVMWMLDYRQHVAVQLSQAGGHAWWFWLSAIPLALFLRIIIGWTQDTDDSAS